jgi:hypothetical protein
MAFKMDFLENFDYLEKNGVFIHYSHEHYPDGSNMIFSIQFINEKTQTAWYGDNHEFGGVKNCMRASVKLALWYLAVPDRIEMIKSGYHDPKYSEYTKALNSFTELLYENHEI